MIKCNVTLNGIISRGAAIHTNNEGKKQLGFTVTVVLPGKTGNKPMEVSVRKDGTAAETARFVIGTRIGIEGMLTFRKRNDNLYLNLQADKVNFNPDNDKDSLEGTLEFRGTIGKQVEEKTDRKGCKYLTFSGFSTEKSGDDFAYTWVRFIRFSAEREPFLNAKAKIQAKGRLELSVFLERLGISCRVEEICEWVKEPYSNPSGESGSMDDANYNKSSNSEHS